MAVSTAITSIFTGCWNWLSGHGIENVYVHCFLDGRDTPPSSGKEYVEQLEAKMKEIGVGDKWRPLWDVIMPWTVTIVGTVWKSAY